MDIESIIDKYISSNKQERDKIMQEVGQSEQLLTSFLGFMNYAAQQSVRKKSKDLFVKGLYANVIEGVRQDYRDNLTNLTLLYHSILLLGLDPDKEFKKVADDTDGEGKELLMNYIKRQPENKTLKCMGYRTMDKPDFDFVWDGFNDEYLHGTEYSEETDKRIISGWH